MTDGKLSITDSRGITLTEILITISMISILLSVAFWGYRDRGRELDLQRSALEVVANIEKAREMAMSARSEDGERPEGGYGVHFEKGLQSYIIFIDENIDKDYDAGEEIETVLLTQGTVVISVSPADTSDIVFIPPSPDVYINGSDIVSAEIAIALSGDSGETKKIFVNPAGLISNE